MNVASHQASFVRVVVLIGIMTLFISPFVHSCQVYPSEYAYHIDSFARTERSSANCRRYPIAYNLARTEDYIHCDGTQLRLTDSDFGSEQYSSSDYYVWRAGATNRQLLFTFPTRVNLTTITLHYYSDSVRGLPRLRFYAVPDEFYVWDSPTATYSGVEVAAVPPGEEPAGRKNVTTNCNFNTRRVLMVSLNNGFEFALSEVKFATCNETTNELMTTTQQIPTATAIRTDTVEHDIVSVSVTDPAVTTTGTGESIQADDKGMDLCTSTSVRESIAWTVATVSTVLFIGLLTINMIMLWVYKKRQVKDNKIESPMYEMAGNPCYEVSNTKRMTERAEVQEIHLYERVAKQSSQLKVCHVEYIHNIDRYRQFFVLRDFE